MEISKPQLEQIEQGIIKGMQGLRLGDIKGAHHTLALALQTAFDVETRETRA